MGLFFSPKASGFRCKTKNALSGKKDQKLSRCICLKKLSFCSLSQKHDGPKFPEKCYYYWFVLIFSIAFLKSYVNKDLISAIMVSKLNTRSGRFNWKTLF